MYSGELATAGQGGVTAVITLAWWSGIDSSPGHCPLHQFRTLAVRAVIWSYASLSCRAGNNWWWVPVVAPCVGAVLGSLIYQLLVEIHHPVEDAKNEEAAKDVPPEKWKEIPIFTINKDSSMSHRL